ncbi:MAG: hypothetical protein DYH05_09390 [Acidobacteria bacterium ACB1]|nr:hypothetical protein [Pyrinomonadaceae bacterium]MCE7962694.1 hypothetical protein [Acidobacteria bacterium ACB1]RIJ95039.1 MAG: hypothetical protein DCC44_03110 [Acidobacteriota bacterium]
MNKLLFTVLLCLISTTVGFAQVKVTPKKTIYKRPKPLTEYKKSFTITWPKVSGVSPAVARKIENALNYEKLFNFTIKEERTELQWLEEASYDVLYNKHNILCIGLTIEGTAAYPSGAQKYVVLDTRNGTVALPTSAFTNRTELAALVNKRMEKAIADEVSEWKKDPDMADLDQKELLGDKVFREENLVNFSIDAKGVTFRYEFGFPHAVIAAEPDSEYTFTWAEMKPYIAPRGLLAVMTR